MPVPFLLPGYPPQRQLTLTEIAQSPKQPFTINDQGNFETIRKQSTENLERLAVYFSGQLHQSDCLSPKEAKASDLAQVVRVVSKCPKQSRQITQLKTEFLAFQLGIPSTAFSETHNPGFKAFAEGKPPLAPYLAHYDHTLQVNKTTGEVFIRTAPEGTYQPWSTVKKVIDAFRATSHPKTSEPWFYGQQGIQTKDMFVWKNLEPMDVTLIATDKPLEAPQYFVEICTCTEERPKLFGGDHTWTRLIVLENSDQKGFLKQTRYSVGEYSPYGKTPEQRKLPMAVQGGSLQSPDVSEFWPFKIDSFRREITLEQFTKIKNTFERHKQEEVEGRPQPIQLCGQNCTAYAMKVSREAGVELPDVTEDGLYLLGQTKELAPLGKTAHVIRAVAPTFVSDSMRATTAIFINILFLWNGASQHHEAIKGRPILPLYSLRSDVLNTRILTLEHPWGVRRVARQEQETAKTSAQSALASSSPQ